MRPADLTTAITQLRARRSGERISAAKWLRKNGVPAAADALRDALEHELADVRTWEVQYHMVMALAACHGRSAVPLIERVLREPVAPMVHLAAGDALVRLADDLDAAVGAALRDGPPMRLQGAARALAMTRAAPGPTLVDALVARAADPREEQLRHWVAAAAAGWKGDAVRSFLSSCAGDSYGPTRRAAKSSLKGKYETWSPL